MKIKHALFIALFLAVIGAVASGPHTANAGDADNGPAATSPRPVVTLCADHGLAIGQIVPLGKEFNAREGRGTGLSFGVECSNANYGGIVTIR